MTGREFRWRVEALVVRVLYMTFRALPLDAASAVGGWLGRKIGYPLPVTRRARRNLARAFPEKSDRERERLLVAMWDNLGRNAAEFAHLDGFTFGPGKRVEVEGFENLVEARKAGRGVLMFSAHLGNWELFGVGAAAYGFPLHLVYRAPNNPRVRWLFEGQSRGNAGAEMLPKGAQGARRVLELLHQGGHIGLLVDQKMNDGIPVPFFGRDAMTAPAIALFALKYRCPVVPAHVERTGGANFRIVLEPALAKPATGDRHSDILAIMTEVNRIIEGWVRRHPEQWLWVHKRWPE